MQKSFNARTVESAGNSSQKVAYVKCVLVKLLYGLLLKEGSQHCFNQDSWQYSSKNHLSYV